MKMWPVFNTGRINEHLFQMRSFIFYLLFSEWFFTFSEHLYIHLPKIRSLRSRPTLSRVYFHPTQDSYYDDFIGKLL